MLNLETLSDIIQGEKEVMDALELARDEQSLSHAIGTLHKLFEAACYNMGGEKRVQEVAQERVKKFLRGLGKINRATRILKNTEIST